MREISTLLRSDMIKLRRTFMLFVTLLAPALTVGFALILVINLRHSSIIEGINPWRVFGQYLYMLNALILPPIVFLITYRFNQIEHLAGHQRLFHSPQGYTLRYITRSLLMLFIIANLVLASFLMNIIGGFIINLTTQLPVFRYSIYDAIAGYHIRLFFSLGLLSILHNGISSYSRSMLFSIAVPLCLSVAGVFIYRSEWSIFNPYDYAYLDYDYFLNGATSAASSLKVVQTIYAVLFLFGGYILFLQSRKLK